jgi:hypothetical protein
MLAPVWEGFLQILQLFTLNLWGKTIKKWFPGLFRVQETIMNYQILTGTSSGLLSEAQGLVNSAASILLDKFRIKLIQQSDGATRTTLDMKPGCQWLTPPNDFCVYMPSHLSLSCGPLNECTEKHHRSAAYYLNEHRASGQTKNLLFVDFNLCTYYDNDGTHGLVTGMCSDNIIATTGADYKLHTVVHEICHAYGGRHCSDQLCVMYPGGSATNRWCTTCDDTIKAYLASH